MANKQSQNGGDQIDEIRYKRGGYSKCVHVRTGGRGGSKSQSQGGFILNG